jgi:hypothetical protein
MRRFRVKCLCLLLGRLRRRSKKSKKKIAKTLIATTPPLALELSDRLSSSLTAGSSMPLYSG